MTIEHILEEAKKLPVAEQAELVDALIVHMGPEGLDVPMTPAQRADLKRRIEESRSGRAKVIDGDEAFAQLRKRS
jgi:putative addiction module component (TIGR02574 family)